MFIKNTHIFLRAVEKSDLDVLYACENDMSVWKVSNTQTPFSKYVLEQYLDTAHQDIYTNKQLRLMICRQDSDIAVGTIDLFEFEPAHARMGVGVLIFENFRNKGYAYEALCCLKQYAFETLLLNQLYCNISASNGDSIRLFEKLGFQNSGLKKSWNKTAEGRFEDELFYQLIRS